MAIERNQELKQRYLHRDEAGVRPLSDAEIAQLNQKFNLTDDLGIPVGEDGFTGNTRGISQNVPRVFFVANNPDMSETTKTPEQMGIKIGSKEFWRQVQLGNVFVHPVGQAGSSQLQVSDPAKGEPSVSLSKEITRKEDLPNREIKAPGFFKRVFSFLSSRWREQVRSYDNQGNSNSDLEVDSYLKHRSKDVAQNEKRDWDTHLESVKKEAERETRRGNHDKVNAKYSDMIVKDDNVERIFGPKPEIKKSWIATYDEDGVALNSQGHATKETFDKLKTYNPDFDKIRSKTLKKPFTKEDFITLAFFGANKLSILKSSTASRQGVAPEDVEKLQKLGLDKDTATKVAYDQGAGNACTDYYDVLSPRGDTGEKVLGPMVQPAREETNKAFEAYAQGNKNLLAEMVANAVERSAFEHCQLAPETAKSFGSRSAAGVISQAANLAELVEKDPELIKIAKEKYGMKDADLNVVKGIGAFKKLSDKRKDAQEKLALAEMNGEELSADVKKQCVKDIVKADLAEQVMINDRNNLKLDEKYKGICDTIRDNLTVPATEIVDGKKVLKPLPPDKFNGYVGLNYADKVIPGMLCERPKFVQALPLSADKLDLAAESVMKQENLLNENMSPKQVFEKMENHMYSPESLKKTSDILTGKEQPEAQKNLQQQPSIDDRKKMFENKQQFGPIA